MNAILSNFGKSCDEMRHQSRVRLLLFSNTHRLTPGFCLTAEREIIVFVIVSNFLLLACPSLMRFIGSNLIVIVLPAKGTAVTTARLVLRMLVVWICRASINYSFFDQNFN